MSKLYCVLVEGGSSLSTNEVEAGFHQVWEADSEKSLLDMIWLERVECAQSYSTPEGVYYCECCGESGDLEDCQHCGSEETTWEEEDFFDFVNDNSCFHYVEYDPNNKEHALCTSYKGSQPRPEHDRAVKYRDLETLKVDLTIARKRVESSTLALRKSELEFKDTMERVVKKFKEDILIESVGCIQGTSDFYNYENLIVGGIYNFLYPLGDLVDLNDFVYLIPEEYLLKALEGAEVQECPCCGWWCDDVHHEIDGEGVCSSCAEESEQ